MDETIYVIFKVQFDFALEVWFSIYTIHDINRQHNGNLHQKTLHCSLSIECSYYLKCLKAYR